MSIIDENGLWGSLPTFCAASRSRVPDIPDEQSDIAAIPGCWLCASHLGGEPTTSSICCVRLPRCHWDKNYTWQKGLRSHWSNNLEQSSGRSVTPLAVTVVIWTKTETVFVWAMSAPEEFSLSRAIQMFALLLLLPVQPKTNNSLMYFWRPSGRSESDQCQKWMTEVKQDLATIVGRLCLTQWNCRNRWSVYATYYYEDLSTTKHIENVRYLSNVCVTVDHESQSQSNSEHCDCIAWVSQTQVRRCYTVNVTSRL